MYVLEALVREIPINVPHIMIAYMTSTSSSGCHLPYAHIITSYIESAHVDLSLESRPLFAYDTVDMATLKAMKYHYIRIERRWIHKEDIPDGEHYKGYESPYEIDHPVDFDEGYYLDYNFLYLYVDDGDDEVQPDHHTYQPLQPAHHHRHPQQ
ncbi:hypothetical protein Scep_012402 [Stephania cephalantha]|uniref:Uncharacterized protein n=1 Tax=Stephania cephalantha TaxID=152367 RepID=A0AAP0JF32_9MAGN